MDFNSVELFIIAARTGSLSEAARISGVPLATLSRKVRALEEDFGARLFERGARGLELTQTGARLFASVEPAMAALNEAVHSITDDTGVAGTLRLSIPPHLEPIWPILSSFQKRYPAVRLEVLVTNRRVNLTEDGIDVVLRIGEGGHSSLIGKTILRYRHKVVAAPGLLDQIEITDPADVSGAPTACWRTRRPPSWAMGDQQVPLNPLVLTNDYGHLLELALEGRVITELPPFMAQPALEGGKLVEVLHEYPMPLLDIRLLVVETRALSPTVRAFLDYASEPIAAALGAPDQAC